MRRALGITVGVAALVALAIGGAWLWSIRPWRVVASVNGVALTARELDLRAAAYGGDRREMARTWIAKEVLLGEAVQRSVSVAEADERAAKDILAAWLANAGTTPERFFSEGPLPEEARRQDFKEGLLIHALVKDALRTARFAEFYAALRGKADVRCPEFPELESSASTPARRSTSGCGAGAPRAWPPRPTGRSSLPRNLTCACATRWTTFGGLDRRRRRNARRRRCPRCAAARCGAGSSRS